VSRVIPKKGGGKEVKKKGGRAKGPLARCSNSLPCGGGEVEGEKGKRRKKKEGEEGARCDSGCSP